MPGHHVPPDGILSYAAGNGSSGEDLLVACHLALCPTCRQRVSAAEVVGSALLDRVAPAAPPGLEGLLSQLVTPPPAPPRPTPCPVFPAPLRAVVGRLDHVPWRSVGLGVRTAWLDLGDPDRRTFLLDFPSGMRIPVHGHRGVERSLVLRGGFDDDRSTFEVGDVCWRDDAHHDVRIHPEGRCTTLFVNDGPADFGRLTSLVDWWLR